MPARTPTSPRRRTQAERLEISGRALLTAAAQLIAEKGWEATSAAEIGRRAGYSRAMVDARFGGKDALLDTLISTEFEQRLGPPVDPDARGLDVLLGFFDHMRRLHDEDPRFLESMFIMNFDATKRAAALRPRLSAWLEDVFAGWETALRRGLEDGSVRPGTDPARVTRDVAAAVLGICYGWVMLPERFDFPTELDEVRRRFLRECATQA
ncbi:TetR/AcrR family transcriptional regulator [Pseudonocardia alni]|uniref:TetR/AcrR family transcriptional regulator n=1 Tax=Pseudonocardia alni TaxID=33907 RepID=UPI00332A68A0